MCGIKGAFIQFKMGMRQVGALRVSMLFASRKQAIFRPFLGVLVCVFKLLIALFLSEKK